MKVLYAIQGTGNGHIARATEIVPILKQKVDLDILCSGLGRTRSLPFKLKYSLNGLGFQFGAKGGIDLWGSYKDLDMSQVLSDIRSLPIHRYDLVINDFEPITAWSARLKGVPCISLSHQASLNFPEVPKPGRTDWINEAILKYYAPSDASIGFHFKAYNDSIYTPIIRSAIREKELSNQGHYTVYLPSYSNGLIMNFLSKYPQIKWHIFSRHSLKSTQFGNYMIFPLDAEEFAESMASSKGVICGAGFETPSEALFLRKKLLVVPMKAQFEQKCNAMALEQMGVSVIPKLHVKYREIFEQWLEVDSIAEVDYPDQTELILENALTALTTPVQSIS